MACKGPLNLCNNLQTFGGISTGLQPCTMDDKGLQGSADVHANLQTFTGICNGLQASAVHLGSCSEVLEWPCTVGGVPPLLPPPPLQTKVTIVGGKEICNTENLVGPFLVHKFLGPIPRSPPPPLPILPCVHVRMGLQGL